MFRGEIKSPNNASPKNYRKPSFLNFSASRWRHVLKTSSDRYDDVILTCTYGPQVPFILLYSSSTPFANPPRLPLNRCPSKAF